MRWEIKNHIRKLTIYLIFCIMTFSIPSILMAKTNISGYISISGFELPVYGNYGFLGIDSLINFTGNVGEKASYNISFNATDDFSNINNFSINFKEAYMSYSTDLFDLYIGKQIVSWGLADGINPTDNINPRYIGTKYTTDLDSLKIGIPMLRCDIYPSDMIQIELVALPAFIPNSLPSMAFLETVSPTLTVEMKDDSILPSSRPENIQGGFRTLFYLDNLTFSLSYLYIFDRYPDIHVTTEVTNPGPPPSLYITMQPEYNRIHVIGGDFQTSFAGLDIRGENAFFITKDTDGNDPYIKNSYIKGILEVGKGLFSDRLNITGGWIPQYVFNYMSITDYPANEQYAAEEIYKHNGQAYKFENGLFLRLKGSLINSTLEPETTFIYNTKAKDFLFMAKVKYNIADGLNLTAGTDIYGSTLAKSDPDREYGIFSNSSVVNKDTIYAEIKLNF